MCDIVFRLKRRTEMTTNNRGWNEYWRGHVGDKHVEFCRVEFDKFFGVPEEVNVCKLRLSHKRVEGRDDRMVIPLDIERNEMDWEDDYNIEVEEVPGAALCCRTLYNPTWEILNDLGTMFVSVEWAVADE